MKRGETVITIYMRAGIETTMTREGVHTTRVSTGDEVLAEVPLDGLQGHDLSQRKLRWANLAGLTLRNARLDGAVLDGSDLRRADLTGASLRSASIIGATLLGARLVKADLTYAFMPACDLRSADLHSAHVTGARFRDCLANGNTVWPSGFDPVEAGIVEQGTDADLRRGLSQAFDSRL